VRERQRERKEERTSLVESTPVKVCGAAVVAVEVDESSSDELRSMPMMPHAESIPEGARRQGGERERKGRRDDAQSEASAVPPEVASVESRELVHAEHLQYAFRKLVSVSRAF